jgi:hypothetical protein
MLSWARAHRRVRRQPSERRLCGRSNRRRRPAEVFRVAVDDNEGPRWSSPDWRGRRRRRRCRRCVHGLERFMGRERSGDCIETGGSAVKPRLPRFLHACDRGRFRGVFCLYPAWPSGKPPIRTYPLGLREGCFNAHAGLYRGVLWASKRAAICSPGPGPTAHRLPITPQMKAELLVILFSKF